MPSASPQLATFLLSLLLFHLPTFPRGPGHLRLYFTAVKGRSCLLCDCQPRSLQLAKTYSYAHGWMHRGWNCGDYFADGITNGASWYSLSKGKGWAAPTAARPRAEERSGDRQDT